MSRDANKIKDRESLKEHLPELPINNETPDKSAADFVNTDCRGEGHLTHVPVPRHGSARRNTVTIHPPLSHPRVASSRGCPPPGRHGLCSADRLALTFVQGREGSAMGSGHGPFPEVKLICKQNSTADQKGETGPSEGHPFN